MPTEPWSESEGGLLLTVRVTPRASRTGVTSIVPLSDGRAALAIRLAAPPVDGAPNAELIAFLSKALGVPKSAIALTVGHEGRVKTLRLFASGEALVERLRIALEA